MKKVFNILLALFLILNCNTVYTVEINKSYHFKEILLVVVIMLVIFQMYEKKSTKIKKSDLMFLMLSFVFLAIFLILRTTAGDARLDYIYLFLILFPLLYFLYTFSRDNEMIKDILKEFSNVMIVIAILSLVMYFSGSIFKIIQPTNTTTIGWGGTRVIESYYGIHFNVQKQAILDSSFLRNTGIFAEGPMYSLVLTIALAIELFVKQKKSIWRVILFVTTIVTTVSITGVIIAAFLIIMKFLLTDVKTKTNKYAKLLIIPFIGIVGIYILFTALDLKKNDTASFGVRMDDYKASFLAWKDHLILGNGYKDNASIIQYMSATRLANTGLSNSILVLLAQCGIYLGIFYMYPAVRMIKNGWKTKNINAIIFTITILLLFITTIFPYKAIAINFLAMGYAYKKNEINK